MNKKIIISAVTILIVVATGFLFLGGIEEEGEKSFRGEQTIKISGSSSGITILEILAEAFEKKNPGITIRFLPGTSTGDGVRGVAEGLLDIGTAARLLKESEKERYPNITELTYVRDAMVLGVSSNVVVTNLTSEQVKKIYSGEITHWNEVGGNDVLIIVLDREESESSKLLLRRDIFGPDLKITDNAILLHSSGSTNKTLEDTPDAIGQTSLGIINLQNLAIKPLSINGVVPGTETIEQGLYKMVRNYGIIIPQGELPPAVKAFVDFLSSAETQKFLEEHDFAAILHHR